MTLTAPLSPSLPSEQDLVSEQDHLGDTLLAVLPPELVARVRVERRDGVVVLSGNVPTIAAWRRVRTAALAAEDVAAVADEIQVDAARRLRGADRSEPIARRLRSALRSGESIAVQTDDGITTLWGHVRTANDRQRVLEAVRDVVGGGWVQTRVDVG